MDEFSAEQNRFTADFQRQIEQNMAARYQRVLESNAKSLRMARWNWLADKVLLIAVIAALATIAAKLGEEKATVTVTNSGLTKADLEQFINAVAIQKAKPEQMKPVIKPVVKNHLITARQKLKKTRPLPKQKPDVQARWLYYDTESGKIYEK